ncbi:MAG: hypothetical protein WCT14_17600 [Treponemataceae bacterium]
MPSIMIAEAIQVLIYLVFGIAVAATGAQLPLYVALGFVVSIGLPSLFLGYGFKGMKASVKAGTSSYERFRGTPIANGIWGVFHLILAAAILGAMRDGLPPGLNLGTILVVCGFCVPYLPLSLAQSRNAADDSRTIIK